MRKGKIRRSAQKWKPRNAKALLAYSASLMLTGVPPIVCESAIDDILLTVKHNLFNRHQAAA